MVVGCRVLGVAVAAVVVVVVVVVFVFVSVVLVTLLVVGCWLLGVDEMCGKCCANAR